MEGKIKISEDEVKAIVRKAVSDRMPFRCRITDISTRYSYSLDLEVDFTDEPESEKEPDDSIIEVLFPDDIPDEAA